MQQRVICHVQLEFFQILTATRAIPGAVKQEHKDYKKFLIRTTTIINHNKKLYLVKLPDWRKKSNFGNRIKTERKTVPPLRQRQKIIITNNNKPASFTLANKN